MVSATVSQVIYLTVVQVPFGFPHLSESKVEFYTTGPCGNGNMHSYSNVADSRRSTTHRVIRVEEDQQDLQQETHGYQVAMADGRGWSVMERGWSSHSSSHSSG